MSERITALEVSGKARRVEPDRWQGLDVPPETDVCGLAWPARPDTTDHVDIVVCFSPRRAGVTLLPVAERLKFSCLSDADVRHPAQAELAWHEGRLELAAFGRPLWSADGLTAVDQADLRSAKLAIVLVVDQSGGFGYRDFPRLPPSSIRAGYFWVAAWDEAA